MNILVTGGGGFIGSRLVRRLCESNHAVTVIDDLSTGSREVIDPRAELVVADVSEPLPSIGKFDYIFHLAAVAAVEKCNQDLLRSHRVNLGGFLNVLDYVRRDPETRIVYASSAAVYGRVDQWPTPEDCSKAPLSPYGADKLACELHAASARVVFGIDAVGFRFFNVFGPGQDPESPYSGVITRFLSQLKAGCVSVFGNGEQTRDFVYVEDVVTILVATTSSWPTKRKVFNVCTGKERSISELAEAVISLSGNSAGRIEHLPARAGDIDRSIGDNSALLNWAGPIAFVSLEEGLRTLMRGTPIPAALTEAARSRGAPCD